MKCPQCGNIRPNVIDEPTPSAQLSCSSCNFLGTLTQFGVDKLLNVGLVNQLNGAVYEVHQNFMIAADPEMELAITTHQVDNDQVATNTWACIFGQWIKVFPESVSEGQARISLLNGQIMRFVTGMGTPSIFPSKHVLLQTINLLQEKIQVMIKQEN